MGKLAAVLCDCGHVQPCADKFCACCGCEGDYGDPDRSAPDPIDAIRKMQELIFSKGLPGLKPGWGDYAEEDENGVVVIRRAHGSPVMWMARDVYDKLRAEDDAISKAYGRVPKERRR